MEESSINVIFQCSHHHNTLLLIHFIVWVHVSNLTGWKVNPILHSNANSQSAFKEGFMGWSMKDRLLAVPWNWGIESIPKGPHMNSETEWNGILMHFLLCHWNIYIGCYKSTWQILVTTWKPQEIFYSCLIYENSWCQKKKKKDSEFRSNVRYLLR